MAFFDLLIVDKQTHLRAVAGDQSEALAILGKQLDQKLSLEDSDEASDVYLLDEWTNGPHYVNPTIRVFATAIPSSLS
jgi:hypothetical protein